VVVVVVTLYGYVCVYVWKWRTFFAIGYAKTTKNSQKRKLGFGEKRKDDDDAELRKKWK
jgi:hypothetical protein